MKYTIKQISDLDREIRQLVEGYNEIKIKANMELAKRLRDIRDNKLYLQLDSDSYPSFPAYVKSVGYNYKTIMGFIGTYESYILAGELSIEKLSEVGYGKLTKIKKYLFEKDGNEYKLKVSKSEFNKWISDAKSDITQDDLMQKRREAEAGEHQHNMIKVAYEVCTICKLREYHNHEEKKREEEVEQVATD